jgi:hypothetical protein
LGLKRGFELLQAHYFVEVKVLLIGSSVRNHTNLFLHFMKSLLAEVYFRSLFFSLPLECLYLLCQKLLLETLLLDIVLQLFVVAVYFRLHTFVDVLHFLNQLVHQNVSVIS